MDLQLDGQEFRSCLYVAYFDIEHHALSLIKDGWHPPALSGNVFFTSVFVGFSLVRSKFSTFWKTLHDFGLEPATPLFLSGISVSVGTGIMRN